jgi:hypothetical protein
MSQLAPRWLRKKFRQFGGKIQSNQLYGLSAGWERLLLFFGLAVGLTLWLTWQPVDANSLFQSPQSPVVEPVPIEQPPVVPIEQPPVVAPESPLPQPVPIEQPPIEQPPIEQPPIEQPPIEQPQQPVPEPVQTAPEAAAPEPSRREREETVTTEDPPSGPSQFILDQAEFIDTVVISGAYIWLCCGVGLMLIVPLALVFVYIRGRSKIMRGEG